MRIDNVLLIQENARNKESEQYRECFCLQRAFQALDIPCDVWGRGHELYRDLPNWRDYDLIINLEQRADRFGDWIPDLSQARTIKFLWAIDAHGLGTHRFDDEFRNGKYHLLLHSTKKFVTGRVNRHWFPNGWDDSLIGPREVELRADIGFVGDVSNRRDWISLLESQNFSFVHDFMVHGEEMVKCLSSYRLCWNRNFSCDVNYRNFEVLGAGGVLVSNFDSQYSDLGFENGKNFFGYTKKSELVSLVRDLIDGPNEKLETVRKEALELSKKHTYKARVARLLEEVSWKY